MNKTLSRILWIVAGVLLIAAGFRVGKSSDWELQEQF